MASLFDIARTIVRRAERRVIGISEPASKDNTETKVEIGPFTKAYLNRLSSLLYALARLANHRADIKEESPDYK